MLSRTTAAVRSRVDHVALAVADLDRSIALYRSLGFGEPEPWEGEGGRGVDLPNPPGGALELHETGDPARTDGFRHLALAVSDIDLAREQILTHGGTAEPIRTTPRGWSCIAADPDGWPLELIERRRAAEASRAR